MVESCSKKVAASGSLHLLLQFRRGALAALCYISAAKWKYANSDFTNKAFGMALSARYSLQRIKYFFANSAAVLFEKSLSLPTTLRMAKWTAVFKFFLFLFVPHTTKKSNFANSLFLFRWIIQRIFQNAEQSGEISCPARIGNAENEISATVWAQKKQETVL